MNVISNGFDATVGHTPLIRLGQASEATRCEILGKAEFLNPGGSAKDRVALGIILDAEASGRIRPESLPIVYDLLRHEGLCLGHSSGVNVAGAVRLARELGPGHTVATALCDSGLLYKSKLFNPPFLREKGLPAPEWLA